MRTIGCKLREAREHAGFSQEQVADYLGVDQSLISFWERNTRTINLGSLLRISSLYGYPEGFFDPDEEMEYRPISLAMRGNPKMSAEELEAIANIRKLALNLREVDRILEVG